MTPDDAAADGSLTAVFARLRVGDADAGAVAWFVDDLVREPAEHFALWAGDDGVQRLRTEFPRLAESMGPLIEDCWQELEARLRAIDPRRGTAAAPGTSPQAEGD